MSVGFIIFISLWSVFLVCFVVVGKYSGIKGSLVSILLVTSISSLLLLWPREQTTNEGDDTEESMEKDLVAWPRLSLIVLCSILTTVALIRTVHHALFAERQQTKKTLRNTSNIFYVPN